MNFDGALNILGLTSNYTEEELNKNYYALAKQYHPDVLINKSTEEIKDAEEKMKEINLAYDTLKQIKKPRNNQYVNNDEQDPLYYYREKIINIIESYNYRNIDTKMEFKGSSAAKFFKSIFLAPTLGIRFTAKSKETIDSLFNDLKKQIKYWYTRLKEIYFKTYNIPEDIDFIVDETVSFDEFYNKLENIKTKTMMKEVNDVILSYKLYAYYDEIKDEIAKLITETTKNVVNNYRSKDYFYRDLRNAIDNLFKFYSLNKPLYTKLEEIINNNNLPLQRELESLREKIFSPLFYIYYMQLKLDINNLSQSHEEEIAEIKNHLTQNYNETIRFIIDGERKWEIKYLYKIIINFLNMRDISFESIKLLREIDFRDYEEALNIYECVRKNLITAKKVDVYINVTEKNTVTSKHIKIDDEEYDMISHNGEKIIYENSYNMNSDFIFLDEFMARASDFFITFDWNGEPCIGLYRYNGLVLCIYKGHLEFLNDIMITNIDFPNVNELGIFPKKDFDRNLIINDTYREIQKSKNNNLKK